MVPVDVGITYDCSKNLGALLLLRNHSVRINLRSTLAIRSYIKANIDGWYTFGWQGFAEADLPEQSLVLVRGCDITDSWALAAFADRSLNASVFFNGGIYQSAGSTELYGSWQSSTESSAECREGSVLVESHLRRRQSEHSRIWTILGMDDLPEEFKKCIDCLFIRVFRIRRRLAGIPIPKQIKAQAGPHTLPQHPPDDESTAAVMAGIKSGEADSDVEIELDSECDLVSQDYMWLAKTSLIATQSHHYLDHLLDYIMQVRHPEFVSTITINARERLLLKLSWLL
jgi:hypothetical protein